MKANLKAGAANFASLFGRARAEEKEPKPGEEGSVDALVQGAEETDEDFEKRKSESEEDKKRDDETDDDHQARVSANKARRTRQANKAESGEEDDEGDDSSDKEDTAKASVAAARSRERSRCAAIMGDKAVARNPDLAFHLAFVTDMPRGKAIGLLRSSGSVVPAGARKPTLDERMARVPAVTIPASAGPNRPGSVKMTEPEKVALHSQLVMARLRQAPAADISALEAKLAAAA